MSNRVLTENVSDIPGKATDAKRRRGRPALLDKKSADYRRAKQLCEGGHRTALNWLYQTEALRALIDDPEFFWLFGGTRAELQAGGGNMRRTILQELGRYADPNIMRDMASYICLLKPTARRAVQLIRRHRLGQEPPDTSKALYRELAHTINRYARENPEAELRDMAAAVRNLLDHMERELSDE